MSSKPTTLPAWNTDETNNTEPSAGQKATGWEPNQQGVSDYMNWWMFLVYQWTQYLNDGELQGDVTIDGTLTVERSVPGLAPIITAVGNVAIDGDVAITGDVRYGTARSKVLSPSDGAYTTLGTGKILGLTDAIPATAGSGVWECTATSGGFASCRQHMNLESAARVAQIKVRVEVTSGGQPEIQINRYDMSTGVHTLVQTFVSPADFGPLGVGNHNLTLTLSSPITLADGEDVSVALVVPAVADKLRAIQPYWSRP